MESACSPATALSLAPKNTVDDRVNRIEQPLAAPTQPAFGVSDPQREGEVAKWKGGALRQAERLISWAEYMQAAKITSGKVDSCPHMEELEIPP